MILNFYLVIYFNGFYRIEKYSKNLILNFYLVIYSNLDK